MKELAILMWPVLELFHSWALADNPGQNSETRCRGNLPSQNDPALSEAATSTSQQVGHLEFNLLCTMQFAPPRPHPAPASLFALLATPLHLSHPHYARMRRHTPSTNMEIDLGRRQPSGPDASLTWSLQALLVRHETYVAEAEQDRVRLDKTIAVLETRTTELEDHNKRLVDDNALLSSKLDQRRVVIAQSDAQIQSLTTILETAQHEISKLSSLAARTEQLEARIVRFESDRAQIQNDLKTSKDNEQMTAALLQDSKKEVDRLQRHIDEAEQTLAEERRRSNDVVERMEKRRAVEREMDERDQRTRRVASMKSGPGEKRGGEVVSSFVREILQDNANLQLKMLELQDSLQTSSEELEELRAQLTEARSVPLVNTPPPDEEEEEEETGEVTRKPVRKVSQELHVHHHYHGPKNSHSITRTRSVGQRQKKKRQSAISGRQMPTRPPSPHISSHYRDESISSSVVAPSPKLGSKQRPISMLPMRLASSEYSSMNSTHSPSTIFEPAFDHAAVDQYSRPTSPDSEFPYYSTAAPPKRRHASGASGTSGDSFFAALGMLGETSSECGPVAETEHEDDSEVGNDYTPRTVLHEGRFGVESAHFLSSSIPRADPAIFDTTSHDPQAPYMPSTRHPNPRTNSADVPTSHDSPRPLRRTASHSSILSISGMDINAYTYSPGSGLARNAAPAPPSLLQSARCSSRPVLDRSTALARAPSATLLLSATMKRNAARPESGSRSAATEPKGYTPLTDTFGRLGGWFGRRSATAQGVASGKIEMAATTPVAPTGSAVDQTALLECLVEEDGAVLGLECAV